MLNILIACEFSGIVREAFKAKGHGVWSCDLLPSDIPGQHIQDDVLDYLDGDWDLMIAHPPCTHLAVSGAAWFKNKQKEQAEALEFVKKLLNAPIPRIALENPIGVISTRIRKPNQIIQPYQFGEPVKKATCLWLKNLPKLIPTKVVENYKPLIRSNVTARARRGEKQDGKFSGGLVTAKTFAGIAEAMAMQWGKLK